MGMVKRLWIEMENYEWEFTGVSFKCPACSDGDSGTVEVPVIYEGMDEVDMPVSVMCDYCDTEFDGIINVDWNESNITLDEFQHIGTVSQPVRGFQDTPDIDWEDLYPPSQDQSDDRPYTLLIEDLNSIGRLVAQSEALADQKIMLRMLLVQTVTALETFLGDTLLMEVNSKEEAQKRLLMNNDLEIGTTKILLKDTFLVENFALQRLMQALKAVSYHNIRKVHKLYLCGLGLDITPGADDLKVINNSILVRHDCVHRNGRAKDSDLVNLIDRPQIEELIESIKAMANKIDDKLMPF